MRASTLASIEDGDINIDGGQWHRLGFEKRVEKEI